MTLTQVIALINQWIVQNGNQEITAEVLNPILKAMVHQPNDITGVLTDLNTSNQTNLVGAINSLKTLIDNLTSINLIEGTEDPNVTPPSQYNIADFYLQTDGNVIFGLYQYNGYEWILIRNVIDDSETAPDTTWSSEKISELVQESSIYINVKDFGAVGDGVADDTQAYIDAIDSAPEQGAVIFTPSGKYQITEEIQVDKQILFLGEGRSNFNWETDSQYYSFNEKGSVVFNNTAIENLFVTTVPGVSFKDISLVNFNLGVKTSGVGIKHIEAGSFLIDNVSLTGFHTALDIHKGNRWYISNSAIIYPYYRGIHIHSNDSFATSDTGDAAIVNSGITTNRDGVVGVKYESSGGLRITNVKINPANSTRLDHCIDVEIKGTSSVFLVSNSSFEGFEGRAIKMKTDGIHTFKQIVINGNQMSSYTQSPTAMEFDGNANAGLFDILVTNNTVLRDIFNQDNDPPVIVNNVGDYYEFNNVMSGFLKKTESTGGGKTVVFTPDGGGKILGNVNVEGVITSGDFGVNANNKIHIQPSNDFANIQGTDFAENVVKDFTLNRFGGKVGVGVVPSGSARLQVNGTVSGSDAVNDNEFTTKQQVVLLSGTEVGKPITGDLFLADAVSIKAEIDGGGYYLGDIDVSALHIPNTDTNNPNLVVRGSENSKGVVGIQLFDKQNDPNAFAQMGDLQGYIPLGGTESDKPITGNIRILGDGSDLKIYSLNDDDTENSITFGDGTIGISGSYGANFGDYKVGFNNTMLNSNNPLFKGHTASAYYGANYDDNTYTQKKYVDNNILITTDSALSLSTSDLFQNNFITFKGTTSTFELPPASENIGKRVSIFNKGMGDITINTETNEIWEADVSMSTTMVALGTTTTFVCDGEQWNIL